MDGGQVDQNIVDHEDHTWEYKKEHYKVGLAIGHTNGMWNEDIKEA